MATGARCKSNAAIASTGTTVATPVDVKTVLPRRHTRVTKCIDHKLSYDNTKMTDTVRSNSLLSFTK